MKNLSKTSQSDFLCPKTPYHGQDYLQGFLFNNNLQEFTHRVGYISALHSNGKLSSQQAYRYIEQLWEKVELSSPKPRRSSK
ncbi:DUF7219 family protein [Cyanobacterium sp. IPPAS B-1200]|uniref:DUF7219 family protein n=1 Tax=Cyanobacterium sp. IPPAS B-1200 TaxID=1562720 RepID=UPI000902071C